MAQRKQIRKKAKQKKTSKFKQKIKIDGSYDELMNVLLKPINKSEIKDLEIIETQNNLKKWEQIDAEFKAPFKAGEKQALRLLPYHEKFKSFFEITGIYYVSCEDTDFILDAEIISIVQLETYDITPTAKQLYNVYLKTRPYWIGYILQESMHRGFTLALNQMPPTPFEEMKEYLDEAIYRSIE